jgi:hypothetical protein
MVLLGGGGGWWGGSDPKAIVFYAKRILAICNNTILSLGS